MNAERALESPPQTLLELREYRATIDNTDAVLVHLLAERFRCTRKVGQLKARLDSSPPDPAHEAQQVERPQALAEESGLDLEPAKKFSYFIVDEVIYHRVTWRDPDPISSGSRGACVTWWFAGALARREDGGLVLRRCRAATTPRGGSLTGSSGNR